MSDQTTHEALLENTEVGRDLLAYFQGSRAEIAARLGAKEAEVNAFLLGVKDNFLAHPDLVFDNTIVHSKTSLAVTVDPAESSRSEWQVVPSLRSDSFVSAQEAGFANISLLRCYSSAPGYYENPQYSGDWSRTQMQFVLASCNATSAEIDARLAELAITPSNWGSWGPVVRYGSIPIVKPDTKLVQMHLWVRFNNLSMVDGNEPQNITTNGDAGSFVVDRVSVYSPL